MSAKEPIQKLKHLGYLAIQRLKSPYHRIVASCLNTGITDKFNSRIVASSLNIRITGPKPLLGLLGPLNQPCSNARAEDRPLATTSITTDAAPYNTGTTDKLHNFTILVLMEFDGGYFSEDGCRTPKRSGYGVPMKCPAAPKKKTVQSKQKKPPANGYFQSPDIEMFFAMARIRGSCV
ncbi:hypothetical protein R6Q59_008932 [Mikania micrantha]